MAVNKEQQKFLEQLALRIPMLFEAIRAGNIKSEYIVGVRRIGHRHVQLKMVAEVVDAGSNPLQTHGMQAPVSVSLHAQLIPGSTVTPGREPSLQPVTDTLDRTSQLTDNDPD